MSDNLITASEAPLTPVYVPLHHDITRDGLVRAQLRNEQERLFIDHPAKTLLQFRESQPGSDEFTPCEIRDINDLRKHLHQYSKPHERIDPMARYVFVSAGHSEKPLNCSLDSFSLICDYHLISTEFADMLLSFGKPTGRFVGYHQPRCHLEVRPPRAEPERSLAPLVNASGWEMRNCYKLSAMEPATTGNYRVMRQMAVYHSLDLASGRSFTMTVKADPSEIAERVESINRGTVPSTVTDSFIASLETQLLGFSWCTEGWTTHISGLEQQIRRMSQKVSGIPMPSGEKTLVKRITGLEKLRDQLPRQNTDKSHHQYGSYLRHWIRSLFGEDNDISSAALPNIPMENIPDASKAVGESMMEKIERTAAEQVGAMHEFPFDGLQEIHSACTKLREAKLVMQLNAQVLREVREHYQAAFESEDMIQDIKKSCAIAHGSFQHRIKYLEKLLMLECMRIDTLTQVAGDGNGLYGSILQLQGGQVGQLFAMAAHGASARMESMTTNMQEIARNTERDTSSMHVITFFALVFLPGTFLGVRYYYWALSTRESLPSNLTDSQSFFSTPIFEGQAPDGTSSWDFNKELFSLFAAICFPMMVVILLIWGLWLWLHPARRRSCQKSGSAAGDSRC